MITVSKNRKFEIVKQVNQNIPYQIYETETFSKLYEAMEKIKQEWVDKIKLQLIENPQVGKPLKFDWLREKKFGNKRM